MNIEEKAQEYYDSIQLKPYDDKASYEIYDEGVEKHGTIEFDREVCKLIERKGAKG